MFRDSEIQRNGHTNLDQGSAAERGFGVTSSRGSPPLRHATSHRQVAAEADHKITQKLNRLELGRLLKARERRCDKLIGRHLVSFWIGLFCLWWR
jgi:hypothetical protein